MGCGTEVLIVDEVQHIRRHDLRRRLLELSNLSHGVTMICASCHPLLWVEDDPEVQGRWNDYFELRQYTGDRLCQLLSFIELLLPFTSSSYLYEYEIRVGGKKGDVRPGPAKLIEQLTGGILRDIMILLFDASVKALERGSSCLSSNLLKETWQDIQCKQVTDFLEVLQRGESP